MLATWQQMLGAFICGALFGAGLIGGIVRMVAMKDDVADRIAEEKLEEETAPR